MRKFGLLRLFVGSLYAMAVIMLGGCSDDTPTAPESPADEPVETPADEPENPIEEPEESFSPDFEQCDKIINQAVNDFDLELFRAMINNDSIMSKFHNAAISPLSLSFALSMAANTFDSQFASEVLAKLQSDDIAQLNMYFRRLMANQPEGDALKLANSAWYYEGWIKPSKAYSSNLAKAYSAPVNPIDFSNTDRAASIINGWVADHTFNLIDNIIQPGNLVNAVVVLANALTFDCEWDYEFDEKLTKTDVFHGANHDAEIDYLNKKDLFSYYESSGLKAISLPFNWYYDLTVFMPDESETINSVIESLDADALSNLYDQMSSCKVDLSIPKFSSELNYRCNDLIESVGIHLERPHTLYGFTGDEFTKFDNQVSDLYHAAKMSINEKGALAASATVIVDISGGMPMYPPDIKEVTLKIDRPFFYLLRNQILGSILIAGCYTQP